VSKEDQDRYVKDMQSARVTYTPGPEGHPVDDHLAKVIAAQKEFMGTPEGKKAFMEGFHECGKIMADLAKEEARKGRVGSWIQVSELLPKVSMHVVIRTVGGDLAMAHLYATGEASFGFWIEGRNEHLDLKYVLEWTILPPAGTKMHCGACGASQSFVHR
jgi:hypothetical protein